MSQQIDNPLFARFFHRFCGRDRGTGERDLRRELLGGAHGRVIEVGAGNGINFEHYPSSVSQLVAVEPEPYLRTQAEQAAQTAPVPTRVTKGTAAALELETSSADVLVVSGVLCSVSDQAAALAEFRRVLRPGGELRFYEHVRSRRAGFARWQRLVDGLWSRMMGGCHTDRDTLAAITDAGFAIERCRGFGFLPIRSATQWRRGSWVWLAPIKEAASASPGGGRGQHRLVYEQQRLRDLFLDTCFVAAGGAGPRLPLLPRPCVKRSAAWRLRVSAWMLNPCASRSRASTR